MLINGVERNIAPDANLTGADLRRADLTGTDLRRADLTGADLRRANLWGADLTGANLTGADLWGADLWGANLTGADLWGAKNIILGPQRSDGYLFWLTHNGKTFILRAGCRTFTLAEARRHWKKTRGGTPLGRETMAILAFLNARKHQMIISH